MAFGIRGSTPIKDEIELQAHLATLLRLENVGLFLGAGASIPAGGKAMQGVWMDFVHEAPDEAQWMVDNHFIEGDAVPLEQDCVIPNVESLGDALEIALTEWRRQKHPELSSLERAHAQLTRAVVRAAKLQPEWWQSPGGAEADAEQLQHHRAILQKFVAARQPGQAAPWVFTTNYDLAIEWAAESIDLQVESTRVF